MARCVASRPCASLAVPAARRLVEATRYLLHEAFRDPLNARFVLLSESDVPLYDPLTFYQQLMSDSTSRVLACPHKHMDGDWMWKWRMTVRVGGWGGGLR